MADDLDISVVIRTLNEDRWIGHTIQSVLDFITQPEITIVDNNSNDSTLEIVRHFIQEPLLEKTEKKYKNK